MRENVPDEGLGEQTWPSEEEMTAADDAANKKLPKGTSDYQAVWLDSDDEEGNDEDGDDEDGADGMDATVIAGGSRAVEPSIAGDVRFCPPAECSWSLQAC